MLPYFVLSRNYNKQSHDFELFIGNVIDKSGLESRVLSANEYAKITVKPKLGFLWGASIGEAKRYFYGKWLLENPYEALNIKYEHHTEKAIGKHRSLILFLQLKRHYKSQI